MEKKSTTITLDNKLVKKMVMAMFLGGCYMGATGMSNRKSAADAFEEVIETLEAQGWKYFMNGIIYAPKKRG